MKAMLVLEDGSSFEGISIGAPGERMGEVVLNTGVVGYQESMTDPSNAGKILLFTYPLIGNYGVAKKFYESKKCWLEALVIKEESRMYSNWQAERSFRDFILNEDLLTISDVDTRTIAVTIRDRGEMHGIISTKNTQKEVLLKKVKSHKNAKMNNFIKEISVKKPTEIKALKSGPKIGVLDLGMLNSFNKQLNALGCNVTLLPYDTRPGDILGMKFDGLIISNGPENDVGATTVVETVKRVLGGIPVLGISAGHEIIGLALGGRLKRMKVGHHGVNYPIKGPNAHKGEITVQNHSFVIDDESIKNKKGVTITLRNINDNTIEEMESKTLRFVSTQYYPAGPGLGETNEVFKRFLSIINPNKGMKKRSQASNYNEVQYAKT